MTRDTQPNRIRQWRNARGLTSAALAKAANTSKQTIWKLEHGQRRLTQDWLERLAPPLGLRPADLLPADDAASGAPGPPDDLDPDVDARIFAETVRRVAGIYEQCGITLLRDELAVIAYRVFTRAKDRRAPAALIDRVEAELTELAQQVEHKRRRLIDDA